MAEQHTHTWRLTQELIVGGFQVADAHACSTCPATKWSAQSEYRDEWLRKLGVPAAGSPPVEGTAP